jgi:hypothetical protein
MIYVGVDTLVMDRCTEFKCFIDGQMHLSQLEVLVSVFHQMILQSVHLE